VYIYIYIYKKRRAHVDIDMITDHASKKTPLVWAPSENGRRQMAKADMGIHTSPKKKFRMTKMMGMTREMETGMEDVSSGSSAVQI
jgi:hypothetical protein